MANDSGNSPVLMVLDDFQFSLNTIVFQEWQRTTGWKWPAQERFGQMDALQFTGPENDTLVLPGVLYPNWKGDIESLDALRQMADQGSPYQLVDSMGFVQGRWVIEKLDEKQAAHDTSGTPRKVEFSLSLKKFDDGETASDASDILDNASSAAGAVTGATSSTASALSGFSGMVKSVQSTAATALGSLKSAAAQVTAAVAPVMAEAASAVGALNRSIDVVNDLRATAADVAAQVKSIGTVAGALSGTKTLMDKVGALGSHAASATRVVDNIKLMASGIPASATSALDAASTATTGVSSLLASTESAANSLLKKLTS
ncbi:bacteriophage tail-related protein [Caballeronia fortuita]|uniref:Bacteriophage tail-related protein n=1 Tax=Caballeronia fortuita TaxID=1777138 RepID=A0A158E8Q2_9BURK|nr:phage tail protein [Caballeronia fortuita]SAL03080.1 bacteriophage tail-related protein [Caballeronia fortuita]